MNSSACGQRPDNWTIRMSVGFSRCRSNGRAEQIQRVVVSLLLVGLCCCGDSGEESSAPQGPNEQEKETSNHSEQAGSVGSADLPALMSVDLSEETVAGMTLDQIWTIGVELLGWTRELPPDATREGVHQRLLEIKYRDVGDFFHDGGDFGYKH